MDAFTQRFFGNEKVQRIDGQKANAEKQKAMQEHFLMDEACRFGDTLIRYVVAHRKLSTAQRTWGFGLALFCLRGDYPEGIEDFDDLIDIGGASLTLKESKESAVTRETSTSASTCLHTSTFNETEQHAAAQLAENISKYIERQKQQKGLSNSQAAYGIGRAFHSLRTGYPPEEGGVTAFDEIISYASEYYELYH
ncbi:MAG: hypothetical protein PVI90_00615 [Desulfobacteraceae bacterium]|jgi:hypothetical protein